MDKPDEAISLGLPFFCRGCRKEGRAKELFCLKPALAKKFEWWCPACLPPQPCGCCGRRVALSEADWSDGDRPTIFFHRECVKPATVEGFMAWLDVCRRKGALGVGGLKCSLRIRSPLYGTGWKFWRNEIEMSVEEFLHAMTPEEWSTVTAMARI